VFALFLALYCLSIALAASLTPPPSGWLDVTLYVAFFVVFVVFAVNYIADVLSETTDTADFERDTRRPARYSYSG
jgi:membrane protein implicated in regulation of membrane protease activity